MSTATLEKPSDEKVSPETLMATSDAFEEWLGHFSSNHYVGISSAAAYCPAARFLRARCGEASVSSTTFSVDGETYDSPEWLRGFVQRIDALGAEDLAGDLTQVGVTAIDARTALDNH